MVGCVLQLAGDKSTVYPTTHPKSPPTPPRRLQHPRGPREEKRVRNWMDGGTVIRFCSNPMRSQWQCVDLNSPGSVYLLSSNYSCLYIQMWFLAAVWVFSRDRQTKRSTLIAHLHPRVWKGLLWYPGGETTWRAITTITILLSPHVVWEWEKSRLPSESQSFSRKEIISQESCTKCILSVNCVTSPQLDNIRDDRGFWESNVHI